MRIKDLWLKSFKNLQDFSVDFDSAHPVSVVVGRNGTGKSNLLEALTVIFRELDLGDPPSFEYRLRYECRGREVVIDALPSRNPRLIAKVDGVRLSRAKLQGDGGIRYLPDFVFGYYSGPSNRLKAHFDRHQEIFSRAQREGHEQPLRRLFYAQPMHSQFVLLAFYLDDEEHPFLKEHLRLSDLDSVLFVLHKPYWASRKSSGRSGDTRFWHARGAVADLLSELYERALAPMREERDVTMEQGRRERREHLYLYLPTVERIRDLAQSKYESKPQELFKAFESILAADLLSEVRVRVRTQGAGDSLVFRELSEGEQQLLMVLGLLKFTHEDESLFLLDEPDTHLNPAWSMNYVSMVEEASGPARGSSQILMATHDPLVIASLVREQVVLLERCESGAVRATRPEFDPRGMGVAGLLTSDVYNLVSDLDPITLEKVERRRWLASAPRALSAEEEEDLRALTAELESLNFNFDVRDPLYAEFEKAMASLERVDRVLYSAAEKRAEKEKSEEVLRNLVTGDPSDERPDAIR